MIIAVGSCLLILIITICFCCIKVHKNKNKQPIVVVSGETSRELGAITVRNPDENPEAELSNVTAGAQPIQDSDAKPQIAYARDDQAASASSIYLETGQDDTNVAN